MRKSVGILLDSFLLLIFLSLCYQILLQRLPSEGDSVLPKKLVLTRAQLQEKDLLDERISYIADQRSTACRSKTYRPIAQDSVTLVLDFYDYEFFALKVTIASILEHTDINTIKEIIIVDDGTTLAHINDELLELISILPLTKLMRTEYRKGQSHSRNIALKWANSKIIVFIDSSSIVSEGWLPPLIDHVLSHPQTLVQPSFDVIHDSVTYEYVRSAISSLVTFDWKTSLHVADVNNTALNFVSPVLRGNVLAVDVATYKQLGGYDENYKLGGGENFEISIRAWNTCRDIIVSSCSRVAIINRNSPVVIQSSANKKRTASLWMDSFNREIIMKKSNIENTADTSTDITERRDVVLKTTNCKKQQRNFKNYIENIPNSLFYKINSEIPKEYGYLKVSSGHCAHIGNTNRLELLNCPERWLPIDQQMLFTFSKEQLKVKGNCLESTSNMYVQMKVCNSAEDNQKWSIKNRRLINKGRDLCLTHVTDPDKILKPTQILMVQHCDQDSKEDKRFSSFDFINS